MRLLTLCLCLAAAAAYGQDTQSVKRERLVREAPRAVQGAVPRAADRAVREDAGMRQRLIQPQRETDIRPRTQQEALPRQRESGTAAQAGTVTRPQAYGAAGVAGALTGPAFDGDRFRNGTTSVQQPVNPVLDGNRFTESATSVQRPASAVSGEAARPPSTSGGEAAADAPSTRTAASTAVAKPSSSWHAQVDLAETLKHKASTEARLANVDKVIATRHRAALDELVTSAKGIELKEEYLSRRDRSMAMFLLASANAEAATVARQIDTARDRQASVDLASLEQATGRLQMARSRIEAGRPPLDERAVRVSVFDPRTRAPVEGLRVYVLPKDMVERPELYSRELVRELLQDLTFESLTSPAQGRVPLSDIRIWVGREHAYDAMCDLVQKKELHRWKPVHAVITDEILEMDFQYPAGVYLAGGTR